MRNLLMSLGRGLYRLGLARAIIRLQGSRVRGVLYHAVDDDESAYNRGLNLAVSQDTLDRQLNYFSRYYQFVGIPDTEGSTPSAALAISFDDGYSSVYQNAWPILQKYKAPASVFLVTRAVQQQLLWFNMLNWALQEHAEVARKILARYLPEPLPEMPRDCIIEVQEGSSPDLIKSLVQELESVLPVDPSHAHYMDAAQIEEMRAGGISFGFHTVDHYNLINCDAEELARQLDSSDLDALLTDGSFAYPCGYYDSQVLYRVVTDGFNPVMGVGVDNARHHPRHHDRVEIFHDDAADMFAQLEVVEPLLALFRRCLRRETGRRASL